jgi:hypothetical protein
MGNIEKLKEEFQRKKFNFDQSIMDIMSSKMDDRTAFPPYVPIVGKNYDTYNILSYSTAQNIKFDDYQKGLQKNYSRLSERLLNTKTTYPSSFEDIDVNPYRYGILPALLGVFIYAKFGKKIECLNEIIDYVAVTNYYKFSFNKGKKDINPESMLLKYVKKNIVENFWGENDKLVKEEIDILSPKYIIVFKGRKYTKLRKMPNNSEREIFEVNDPSWILRGGGGNLKDGKGWGMIVGKYKNSEVYELIYNYSNKLCGNYKRKRESSFVYLLHYYHEWKKG